MDKDDKKKTPESDTPAVELPNIDVRQALRQSSRLTAIEELQQKGHKQVKVLNSKRITEMINQAVTQAVSGYTSKVGMEERRRIEHDAKREFFKLMEIHQEVVASRDELAEQRKILDVQVRMVEDELKSQQTSLANEQGRVIQGRLTFSSGEVRGLESRLVALMSRLLDDEQLDDLMQSEDVDQALEDYMYELAGEFVQEEKKRAMALDQNAQVRKINNLEKRIEKLTNSLDLSEQMLLDVKAGKSVDEGLASIYRTVQGLENEDESYEKKQALLKGIFEYNLELQKKRKAV